MNIDKIDNKRMIANNLFWRFAERVFAQLVSFLVAVTLARILDPSAYGTVALITIFITILQVFVDSGLGNALIQKKDSDNIDFSTVFFTNIAFCALSYILIFLTAPLIANFLKNLSLVPYIRVLSITVLVSGIKNVQQAYVSKHMMFQKFFFSTLSGTVVSGAIGVIMALNGAEIWALVAQQVINVSIDTLVLWLTVKWRPEWKFSFGRLRNLLGFGFKIFLSTLLDTIYRDFRQLFIGKIYTSTDLAFYNMGENIPNIIINNVDLSIDSVLLPAMAKEQDDRERVKAMTRRSIQISTYIMAPLMVGLAVVSEPLIRVLLTEKWLHVVFFMRIFCFSFLFFPIHTANLNAIKAVGRSDLFLKIEIIKKIIAFILLLITINISVEAIGCSVLVTTFTSQIINSWPNRKLLNYKYIEQLKDILPNLLLSLFMGVCVYLVSLIKFSDIMTLVIQVSLGVFIYIICSILFKIDSFLYVCNIIKSYLTSKNHNIIN